MADDDRWIIAGLGNPGPEYAGNRHNAGHMVVDLLAERMGSRFKAHRTRNEVADGRLAGIPVTLAKPRTYMNTSGGPVAALAAFYKVPPERVVVVHDELDIPFGAIRLKLGGGDNGHNGLRSITQSLGTNAYFRARFGIGRPPGRMDAATFVLRDFSTAERKELPLLIDRCADAVETLLSKGIAVAQNTFHAD
jgi:peptidyl-tRNA hydrolase, PTH1 family